MKYIIVKGWIGFGDRLESLKMCVAFAQTYNLQIYVDWTDSIWTHGSESFYTYFKLVNMPILNSLDDIPADATYYPAYWKDNIKTPMSQELFDKAASLGLRFDLLKTVDKFKSSDVVVFPCIGTRQIYIDSSFFARSFRVIDPIVLTTIRERNARTSLSTSLGVHVRGTDRTKNQIRKEHSIQFMALNAMSNGAFSGKKLIAVGDDAYSIELWKRFFPGTLVFSKLSFENTSQKGNHNASQTDLKVSKYEMNVEALVDFFTLASCERVISTFKDSRFANEARRLHPHVKTILGNE